MTYASGSQPLARSPQPSLDWTQAPEWATLHVYQSWGAGFWSDTKPELGTFAHNHGRWWFAVTAKSKASGYTLPLGIDFRQSVEYRPQEEAHPILNTEMEALRADIENLRRENEVLRARLKLEVLP